MDGYTLCFFLSIPVFLGLVGSTFPGASLPVRSTPSRPECHHRLTSSKNPSNGKHSIYRS
ncbi:hypothetical protein BJX96DRAFT_160706, partial [Aspergillus floccosus]